MAIERTFVSFGGNKAFACFGCRKSFKQPMVGIHVCPQCKGAVHFMGRDFKAPKVSDTRGWKIVEDFVRSGGIYVAGNQMPRGVRDVTNNFCEARDLMRALKGSAFTVADLRAMPSDYHPRRAFIAKIKASKT